MTRRMTHLKSKSSKFEDELKSEEDSEDDVEGVEESGVQLKSQIFIFLLLGGILCSPWAVGSISWQGKGY